MGGVRYRLRLDETAIGWAGESINTLSDGWIEGEDGEEATFLLEFTTAEDPAAPVEPSTTASDPHPARPLRIGIDLRPRASDVQLPPRPRRQRERAAGSHLGGHGL